MMKRSGIADEIGWDLIGNVPKEMGSLQGISKSERTDLILPRYHKLYHVLRWKEPKYTSRNAFSS